MSDDEFVIGEEMLSKSYFNESPLPNGLNNPNTIATYFKLSLDENNQTSINLQKINSNNNKDPKPTEVFQLEKLKNLKQRENQLEENQIEEKKNTKLQKLLKKKNNVIDEMEIEEKDIAMKIDSDDSDMSLLDPSESNNEEEEKGKQKEEQKKEQQEEEKEQEEEEEQDDFMNTEINFDELNNNENNFKKKQATRINPKRDTKIVERYNDGDYDSLGNPKKNKKEENIPKNDIDIPHLMELKKKYENSLKQINRNVFGPSNIDIDKFRKSNIYFLLKEILIGTLKYLKSTDCNSRSEAFEEVSNYLTKYENLFPSIFLLDEKLFEHNEILKLQYLIYNYSDIEFKSVTSPTAKMQVIFSREGSDDEKSIWVPSYYQYYIDKFHHLSKIQYWAYNFLNEITKEYNNITHFRLNKEQLDEFAIRFVYNCNLCCITLFNKEAFKNNK